MENDFILEGVRFKWLRYSNIDELKKKYFVHHVNFRITARTDIETDKVFFGINCERISDISAFKGRTIYFLHNLRKDPNEIKHGYKVEFTIYLNSVIIRVFKKYNSDIKLKHVTTGYPFLLFKDSKDYAKFKIKL